jgi:hypothetical protein
MVGKINSLYASKYVDKKLINKDILGCSYNRGINTKRNGKDHVLLLVHNISTCP